LVGQNYVEYLLIMLICFIFVFESWHRVSTLSYKISIFYLERCSDFCARRDKVLSPGEALIVHEHTLWSL